MRFLIPRVVSCPSLPEGFRKLAIHHLQRSQYQSRVLHTSNDVKNTSSSRDGHSNGAPALRRGKEKCYILPMFPYPSGTLHMGHVRVYTISDVIARYKRMKGYEVLHPMGWDAFGLPAENAAIERGIDPRTWTLQNISKMKDQLNGMGVEFDWDRELMTCSPSFYKHTQKLFLMLHQSGLAYQADASVNWDPVDKTVLANEQVDSDGRSWRSGAIIEKKQLRQWFFRTTAFQHELYDDLDNLAKHHEWPERVMTQQRNWLGKSEGAKLKVKLDGVSQHDHVDVFTTRPDTLFGATYLALSLDHPLTKQLAARLPKLHGFIYHAKSLGPDSKAGFLVPGVTATNPLKSLLSGESSMKTLPVYVAPYVLSDYAEGAVIGVPAHDPRDLDFWRTQNPSNMVPIVVQQSDSAVLEQPFIRAEDVPEAFTLRGSLTHLCGKYAGLRSSEAGRQIVSDLGAVRNAGGSQEKGEILVTSVTRFRLKDWLISRQRYWGTPIPIVHCETCGPVPVPEHQLPVRLPDLESNMIGKLGNPLEKIESWVNTECPKCSQPAKRETDTMDTFVDSAWYFMRFPDSANDSQMFSKQSAEAFLPVDTYVGGVEHAILHLLYARFVYKFLSTQGLIPSHRLNGQEPFKRLISQGMVHGKTFTDPNTGRFLHPAEVEGAETSLPKIKASGIAPAISFEKMSKSKHNGVDPSSCIAKYGADVTRAHMLFSAPVSEVLEWDEEKIVGIERWFGRIQKLVEKGNMVDPKRGTIDPPHLLGALIKAESAPLSSDQVGCLDEALSWSPRSTELKLFVIKTIVSVNHTLEYNIYALNTTVSDLIKLTNAIHDSILEAQTDNSILLWATLSLLRMLAPIAPSFAQQQWTIMCRNDHLLSILEPEWSEASNSIFKVPFPSSPLTPAAVSFLESERPTVRCAVQINGKLRFDIDLPTTTSGDLEAESVERGSDVGDESLIRQLLETEQGRIWLIQRNQWDCRKRVIVVKKKDGSRLVNVVF